MLGPGVQKSGQNQDSRFTVMINQLSRGLGEVTAVMGRHPPILLAVREVNEGARLRAVSV